jgi:rfaE bifunctional protein kinase chain/domain
MRELTVFVSGRFNILHPGHLRLLRFAKECGSKLIVGIESDFFARELAHINENHRLESILSNSYVDEAFIMRFPLVKIISDLKPDIIVKGKEHELKFNIETEALKEYGGRLIFTSGESTFSSLNLIRKELTYSLSNNIEVSKDFIKRKKITSERLFNICKKISSLNVIVIGDIIVDEYINCQAVGMSQEEASIVVTPVDNSLYLGGAAIVAAHASGLGANVNFISVTGGDQQSNFVATKLNQYKVKSKLIEDYNRPTTLKQRYRVDGKSLLRVSYLRRDDISIQIQEKIIEEFNKYIKEADLIVISDFNYGCITDNLISNIIKIAKENNVTITADSQSSSQVGDISRFKNMDIIFPTEYEARIATRNKIDGLVVLAEKLNLLTNSNNIILKLGPDGLIIHSFDKESNNFEIDQIPSFNIFPVDAAGAGDSMLITSSLSYAAGANIWESSFLGNLAAALQISRVGNIPLEIDKLINEISNKV